MNRYRETFKKKHCVFPVIHVMSWSQALINAEIACNQKCDGVFLINHFRVPYNVLLDSYAVIKKVFPGLWIGMNCLDLHMESINVIPSTAGLWVDDAGVEEYGHSPTQKAQWFDHNRKNSMWSDGIYFGGVAFKGMAPISDVTMVARRAVPYMDVVTTSGDKTGVAPAPLKINAMKEAIGDHPLAIASGITPENIEIYLKLGVDAFLVATGISKNFTELDEQKLQKLMKKVNKANQGIEEPRDNLY